MESRAEYVDWEELAVLSRALREGQTPTLLELANVLESFNRTQDFRLLASWKDL
ncbi:MAG: hypothetical protein ACD_75C01181G0002 [uncultured bacterium]|nr:MAG: hypothetical protein ACD_75C01181G0002 [uncultured bacterium]